jgi:hypothetical protein
VTLSETSALAGINSLRQLEEVLEKTIFPDTPDEAKPKVIVKYVKN